MLDPVFDPVFPRYEPDPVLRDRLRLMVDLARETSLPADVVADLRWCDVDSDRRVLEIDGPDEQTVLPVSAGLARLLHLRSCAQRLAWHRDGHRWSQLVRVFEDQPHRTTG